MTFRCLDIWCNILWGEPFQNFSAPVFARISEVRPASHLQHSKLSRLASLNVHFSISLDLRMNKCIFKSNTLLRWNVLLGNVYFNKSMIKISRFLNSTNSGHLKHLTLRQATAAVATVGQNQGRVVRRQVDSLPQVNFSPSPSPSPSTLTSTSTSTSTNYFSSERTQPA